MAGKKRNIKTHPRVRGEDDPTDSFRPPDRPDVTAASETGPAGDAEVVDFKTGESEAHVDKDDKGEGGETPPKTVMRRGEADAPAPPRRQEREDRAVARGRQRDDDGGDDDRGYSRKVQARIKRERAIVNRERALREAAQRELESERTARQELADRVLRIERTSTKVAANADVQALKTQIENLKPQIKAATEAGETAQALDLQIKLGELQTKLAVAEYDLTLRAQNAQVVEENERKERERREAAARAGGGDGRPALPEEGREFGKEFIKANRHWWRRNKEARETCQELDKEILAEIADEELDFEPYSEEHAEELALRLHEEFPDLEICDLDREAYEFDDDDQQRDAGGERRGARVANRDAGGRPVNGNRAPQGRLGQGRRETNEVEMARQGKVVLTEADFAQMRIFKMDPNNPADKKAFAQQRARTILERAAAGEDQRGAR